MKLYTEEQMKETIELAREKNTSDEFILTTTGIFSQFTPIELPSDEEIEKYFSYGYGGDGGSAIYGAKWIIDKLKNQ